MARTNVVLADSLSGARLYLLGAREKLNLPLSTVHVTQWFMPNMLGAINIPLLCYTPITLINASRGLESTKSCLLWQIWPFTSAAFKFSNVLWKASLSYGRRWRCNIFFTYIYTPYTHRVPWEDILPLGGKKKRFFSCLRTNKHTLQKHTQLLTQTCDDWAILSLDLQIKSFIKYDHISLSGRVVIYLSVHINISISNIPLRVTFFIGRADFRGVLSEAKTVSP